MAQTGNILIVDDEVLVTSGCKRILEANGYDVTIATTGQEGLGRAFQGDFGLVVTDLKLPDLDGMEIVRALRSRRPDVAIVVITGYGSVESAVEASRLGVSAYIEKPFTPKELADAVRRALAPTAPGDADAEAADSTVAGILNRALDAAQGGGQSKLEACLIREVLALAVRDPAFAGRLRTEGTRALAGLALSPPAMAAIAAGDAAWIEKRCGQLPDDQRRLLAAKLSVP